MKVARRVRACVIGAAVLLIALVAAWILARGPSTTRLLLAIGATLPLWISLPALARGHRRTCAAMSLCVIPYLVVGLTELIANPSSRTRASLVLFVSFALFVLTIAYLRVTRSPTEEADRDRG